MEKKWLPGRFVIIGSVIRAATEGTGNPEDSVALALGRASPPRGGGDGGAASARVFGRTRLGKTNWGFRKYARRGTCISVWLVKD